MGDVFLGIYKKTMSLADSNRLLRLAKEGTQRSEGNRIARKENIFRQDVLDVDASITTHVDMLDS